MAAVEQHQQQQQPTRRPKPAGVRAQAFAHVRAHGRRQHQCHDRLAARTRWHAGLALAAAALVLVWVRKGRGYAPRRKISTQP